MQTPENINFEISNLKFIPTHRRIYWIKDPIFIFGVKIKTDKKGCICYKNLDSSLSTDGWIKKRKFLRQYLKEEGFMEDFYVGDNLFLTK